jgi:hypothetical protein
MIFAQTVECSLSLTRCTIRFATVPKRVPPLDFRTQLYSAINRAVLDQFFSDNEDLFRWVRPRSGMTGFPSLARGGVARRELCGFRLARSVRDHSLEVVRRARARPPSRGHGD